MHHLLFVLRIHALFAAGFMPSVLLILLPAFWQQARATPLFSHLPIHMPVQASPKPFTPEEAVQDIPIWKIHGCHRYPYRGPFSGKLHRHTGYFCQWERIRPKQIARHRCSEIRVNIRGKCAIVCQYERNGKKCRRTCYLRRVPGRCL